MKITQIEPQPGTCASLVPPSQRYGIRGRFEVRTNFAMAVHTASSALSRVRVKQNHSLRWIGTIALNSLKD